MPARPKGRLAHICSGRARFSFPDDKGNAAFFEDLVRRLDELPEIREATGRPVTGSLVIGFDAEPMVVLNAIAQAGLFELTLPPPPPNISEVVREQADGMDHFFKRQSAGVLDLQAMAFLLFAGIGVAQLARGQIGIPALTAFYYAAGVFMEAGKTKPAQPPGTGAAAT